MTARRLLWTFLLALLLPLAQVAAAAHEVSHVKAATEAGSKAGIHGGHCEMCALAANIVGGGAAASPPVIPAAIATHVGPLGTEGRLSAAPTHAFLSRAPPSSLP